MKQTPIVVALGGNAISRKNEEGNIGQQFEHTRETAGHLANLVEAGYLPVITHGNGPQVGNVLRRVELSAGEIYPIPLHICVADTQAGMGYMITQCLNNALHRRGIERIATTMITCVEVDPNDPDFDEPTKPIGKFLPREQAELFEKQYGWKMKQYGDNEYRRVVASPVPKSILEIGLIRRLVGEGEVLVVGGGGGVAVARDKAGDLYGVDCVVDKDRTTALLAADLGVQTFLIATGTEKVMLRFGKPDAVALENLTVEDAKHYLSRGEFPAGTMGPKIEAALDFLAKSKRPNARVVITDLEHMTEALAEKAGTIITRDGSEGKSLKVVRG
ncbi:MAG: carbamate kinase [Candidatus Sumerlaeaceae bacterium]|nr:carbamate kinase [Candidatus Sumerlaeaceae bacterium]